MNHFLMLILKNQYVWWNEKDLDYRSSLIKGLAKK
ncbi:hypothetical protein CLV95_12017 [Leptospira borgpetersenii serovar Javanica]|nr:hypothetical protein CLV95_12017 [Leptospira borgpetersenii serovar Javanica]